MPDDTAAEIDKLRQAIATLEAQQREFGLNLSQQIAELRRRIAEGKALSQGGSGAIATTSGVAAGARGAAVGGNVSGHVIVADQGATIVIGDQPIAMTAVQHESALGRYLSHVISRNRYLQLQGIRSGGRLVNIELEHIYVTLKATRTRTLEAEEAWLAEERRLAPGEFQKRSHEPRTETVPIKVEEALAEHSRLVVLGDPGSGKTTLLRYLAFCYARDRAEGLTIVRDQLGLPESGDLPILLPLRNLGAYLKANYPTDDGTEGHARLLEFLREYLRGERIDIPDDFFDASLTSGRAVVLFDGMDEVGDFELRRRVARTIEAFGGAYPQSRMVVTSRIVGYADVARLGTNFTTTTIRDFTLADVEQFLTHWHRLVAIGQMGLGDSAEHVAAQQTRHLMEAIRANLRVRELAINPLMLTVIALVHRDRIKLPERRAELYAEAVHVLLGKWDEARGVEEVRIFDDRPFDLSDRRLLLQSIALRMHEAGQKEIAVDVLETQLAAAFAKITAEPRAAERAAQRFLTVVKERTGLLVEAGQGVYRFSHLTFQEYLAAVEVAERQDYAAYTLVHSADPFWREVISLEAGYLSTKNQAKTTSLIKSIVEARQEPEPFHNLVLAAECMRDVGPTRVEADLASRLTQRLQQELERPIRPGLLGMIERLTVGKAVLTRRIAAATALSRLQTGNFATSSPYWSPPYGEPAWITITAGEFWMGSDPDDQMVDDYEKPAQRLFLPEFKIARTPITNAQYLLYLQATSARAPVHWEDGQPPKDQLNHPVVNVDWSDAYAYCQWLSEVTGKPIGLPSEAEWEKAARGNQDRRNYPWGDAFDATRCNSHELGLGHTTPVGLFPAGASPYGCLDMAGNVWEWTRSRTQSLLGDYPYPTDEAGRAQREHYDAGQETGRVFRGGAFDLRGRFVRCACRSGAASGFRGGYDGFRVVVRPCV
jgi:formylglycine-generating enzyme required for sulfatase activity